jgi:hypothetical protein
MAVLPFNPDARLVGVLWPFFAIAAAPGIGLLLRSLIDRFLAGQAELERLARLRPSVNVPHRKLNGGNERRSA